MGYRFKFVFAIASAAVAFYALSGVLFNWQSTQAQQPINDPGAQIRIFESVLQHIQNDYVDEPDLSKVRNGAMRGLAEGLDPYSSYLTAEQVADYRAGKSKKSGIGASFSQVASYLYVVSVLKGSPADEAGLRAGDIIEYIGTKATRDVSLYDAEELIKGEAGSKVKLRILRRSPVTIEVTRGEIKVPEPTLEMVKGVAHLKVNSLAAGQTAKIKKLLEGASNAEKLIVDVRNVADGTIEEAVETANLFIKNGKLATVIGKGKKVTKTFNAEAAKQVYDGKLVALIDLGTAGSGEVVAAAIGENKRGEVVGENSFGAGVERGLFTLSGGDGFLLTVSKWASPEGNAFLAVEREERGVKPTVKVDRPDTPAPAVIQERAEDEDDEGDEPESAPTPAAPKQPEKDYQLEKAIEVLNGK